MGRRHWGYAGGNLGGSIKVGVWKKTVMGRRHWGYAGGGVAERGISEEVRRRKEERRSGTSFEI